MESAEHFREQEDMRNPKVDNRRGQEVHRTRVHANLLWQKGDDVQNRADRVQSEGHAVVHR